jgi:alpha-1,2-mannosyltransferase
MLAGMPSGTRSNAFGLRLLVQPRVQRILAVAILVPILVTRALQIGHFIGLPDWGFDLSFYWTAGRLVLDGQTPYAPFQLAGPYPPQGVPYEYLYPPFLAVLVAPAVALIPDYRDSNWLWAIMGATILAATVALVARREELGSRFDRVILVASAFALGPVVSELILGNVHLLILGLVAGAWMALRRETRAGDIGAGALIGAATLIKVFPGLIVVWFLLAGRPRAAFAAVMTMGVLALATLPIVGLEPWLQYPTVLANLGPPTDLTFVLAPSAWLSAIIPARIAQFVVLITGLALVAWTAGRGPGPIGYAIAVAVSILVAPALYPHYLAIMVFPLLIAIRYAPAPVWIALAIVCMFGLEIDALGDLRQLVNRAMLTIGPIILVAVLVWFNREHAGPRPADTASP